MLFRALVGIRLCNSWQLPLALFLRSCFDTRNGSCETESSKAMNDSDYVQYGCGWSAPAGWRNFDASPTLRFEKIPILGKLYTKNEARFPVNIDYGDITKGLPIRDGSCIGVYCSHVLEHLPLEGFRLALRNTNRMLKLGGTFRLVLPDLDFCIDKYLADDSEEAALNFMRDTGLGYEQRAADLKGLIVSWLGNSQHLWMWNFRSIQVELVRADFVDVRRATFGDCPDARFGEVENKSRWEDCLGVECRKRS